MHERPLKELPEHLMLLLSTRSAQQTLIFRNKSVVIVLRIGVSPGSSMHRHWRTKEPLLRRNTHWDEQKWTVDMQ